jgi:hypothetical protein
MMQQGYHGQVRDSRVIALLTTVESMRFGLGFVICSRGLFSNESACERAGGVCLRYLAVVVVVARPGLTAPCGLVVRDNGIAASEGVGGEGAITIVRMNTPQCLDTQVSDLSYLGQQTAIVCAGSR